MLKALSQVEALRDSPACRVGAETLLTLWRESAERHPYMFFMGTDFRKLKVPFIWYDLLHVLDVLTRFAWLKDDPRLQEMLALLAGKADAQGKFTLESVWTHLERLGVRAEKTAFALADPVRMARSAALRV